MNNHNCLEGFKCPICGSEGPFIIEVKTQVMMYDDGSDDYTSDIHWDGDSYMRCYRCDEDGPAKHFRIPTTQENDHDQ